MLAVTASSLLHIGQADKAHEVISYAGFSVAENSPALNLLYIQSLEKKMHNDVSSMDAFRVISCRLMSPSETYLRDVYRIARLMQTNSLEEFAASVDRIQQSLNMVHQGLLDGRYQRNSTVLPTYAKAYVDAMHGLYMMKMVVFLGKERDEFKDNEKELKKIEHKISECVATCSQRLKTAIGEYPEPDFTRLLQDVLKKYYDTK